MDRWILELNTYETINAYRNDEILRDNLNQYQHEWHDAFVFLLNQLALLFTLNGINPVYIFKFFDLSTKIEL